MKNLLYKEFKLSTHSFYFVIPFLTGALFLIPNWVFFVALMYFFFISAPNMAANYNTQNDIGFSIMMPVDKTEIVKAKIAIFIILEMLHMLTGGFYAFLNNILYRSDNFMMDLNWAFFGIAFTMFALFNIIFFPLYFKTAYNYGIPTILASVITFLYITAIELLVIFNESAANILEGKDSRMRIVQLIIFFAGIAVFAAASLITVKISANRFKKIDL